MNYLAHAYLSFNEPEILVGNMISDFVKGNKKYDYVVGIRRGISLHRLIDSFTDDHHATKKIKDIFRPAYRLYGGAFADVIYDHFLANDETLFTESSLYRFSQQVYLNLDYYQSIFPAKFSHMYPYMKQHNWLYHYREPQGIVQSFGGLMRRSKYIKETDTAVDLFETHYDTFKYCYREFFPSMKKYAWEQLQKLPNY